MQLDKYFRPIKIADFIICLVAIQKMTLWFSATFKTNRSKVTLKLKLRLILMCVNKPSHEVKTSWHYTYWNGLNIVFVIEYFHNVLKVH